MYKQDRFHVQFRRFRGTALQTMGERRAFLADQGWFVGFVTYFTAARAGNVPQRATVKTHAGRAFKHLCFGRIGHQTAFTGAGI